VPMNHLYIVRTGETTWEAQGRLDNLSGMPLSEAGQQAARLAGKQLVPHEPGVLFAGPGEAEQQTAELMAEDLELKVRSGKNLAEVDFGLWQGLTVEEIRQRQPRLYKQWREDPGSVRPPGGETLPDACHRVYRAVKQLLRREKNETIVLILRPTVLGLLRCKLDGEELHELWSRIPEPGQWVRYRQDADGNWSN
jgi:phosphoserine phosphatase